MTSLAILLALTAAAALLWALWDARGDLGELRWTDWLTLLGATGLGVGVSLSAFDALGNHAFRAHEEQLFAVFSDLAPRSSYHPAEVQLLIGWIYEQVGLRVGTSTTVFVGTALLLGGGGPLLAGLAGRLATGRWIGGALPALLLALQPTLVYWRVHGFHVAPSQAAFSACLLAAVIVLRRGDRSAYSAWFLLGSLTVFLRMEYGSAVLATAALPLLGGRLRDLLRPTLWVPGLAVAATLFWLPVHDLMFAVEQREDYRMGLRFVGLHGPVLLRLGVGALGGGLALLGLAAMGCVRPGQRRLATACVLVAGGALLLPLGFIDFGMRHTLPAATALYLAAGAGLSSLEARSAKAAWGAGAVTLLLLTIPWTGQLHAMGERYGRVPRQPPTLPGVAVPTTDLPQGWEACAIYSNVQSICDNSQNCHPVKDMRDPDLVRKRWDRFDGCVYWTVDATFAEVAGVQHEWWPILRSLYPCEPSGRMTIPDQGDQSGDVHMYRILRRP